VLQPHRKLYCQSHFRKQCYDESTRSQFNISIPKAYILLELSSNVKCGTELSTLDSVCLCDTFSRSQLGTSAYSKISDLILELPVNV